MLVAKLFQCRRNHRIKHIEIREIESIAISEVRPLTLLSLNFFDPEHGDLRIGCSQTSLNPEVDLPVLNVHGTKKFPKIQVLKKEFSDNPSYHCENKFHQYVSTCHIHYGSGMKELTFSTILFAFHTLSSLLFR